MSDNPTPTKTAKVSVTNSNSHGDRQTKIMFNANMFQAAGEGTVVGNGLLRQGKTIYLDGLGTRWSGKYYVWGSTHTISAKGYITSFQGQSDSFLTDFRAAAQAQQAQSQGSSTDPIAQFSDATGGGNRGPVKVNVPDSGT